MTSFRLLLVITFLSLSCKEDKNHPENSTPLDQKERTKTAFNGTMKLVIDGKTYQYDDIDWEKSRVKYDDNIRLSLVQERMPQLKFRFPEVKESLAAQSTFKLPDIHRGKLPISINFILYVKEEGKSREAWTFRTGELEAHLKNDRLQMSFDGVGGPSLDASKIYPISGSIDIQL
ncbi:hypothetical protein HZY62_16415 [Maribacter polysiphoniae]|uniref:YceI-like domain-containing protein n=1 Tax=Maribacter polysiphoniae TaxID=429344 RepID=A0A316DYE7_9FLAO|nr:hypothetical protein [Maribacter polysiphoniae]MBD1262186.1 hypothetical protein [Maribacter polysiphoniae]PWK21553.1 hypothetical protein LX92_03704 [Maribacter polysiphoniae]